MKLAPLRATGLVLAAGLGVAVGIAAGYMRWKSPPTDHKGYRHIVILEHAAISRARGGGVTLVVGDSIVERQWLFELCGPVLNAGIGSATTADFAGRVSAIVAAARPARVVVNLGINDHGRGVPEGVFAEHYLGILNEIGDLPTLIVGVPGGYYENTLRKLGRTYIPWPDVETHDGVHLTAQGAEQWQAAVRGAACPTR